MASVPSRPHCLRQALLASVLAAALLSAPVSAAPPATQAPVGGTESLPAVVAASLMRDGYTDVRDIRILGALAVAIATHPSGLPARVVVDRRTGVIIGLRVYDPGALPQALAK